VSETITVADGRWTVELDVFEGPFDLLITLILNEEVDLLEVHLAEIVLAYIERLETRGELDLEAATEFLVLIAALLELKSRLMLPSEEMEGLDIEPHEAVEELLARLLEYKRYRGAADALRERLEAEHGYRYRSAPLPPELRRVTLDAARSVYEPARLAEAIGGLLRTPPAVDTSHLNRVTVSLERRLQHLRELLSSRRRFSFEDAIAGEDRMTQAVTLFALLELYKSGELVWAQAEPFGPIDIMAADRS
jgi:segregation and condensation protein A